MLRILELIEEGRIELLAKDVICQNPTVTPNEKRTAEISRIPDIRLMEVHEQLKAEEAAKGNKVIGECAGIRGSYLLVEESTVPYISEGKSPEKPAHGCPACSSHDWWQR